MKSFSSQYYDDKYFADKRGKEFQRSDGTIEYWGYLNETGEFLGGKEVARAWKKTFNPSNMLDVGAGRGTLIAYANDEGIEAEGFDFSEWAVSDEGDIQGAKMNGSNFTTLQILGHMKTIVLT